MEQLKSNPSIRELKNSELDIAVPYLDKGGPRSADLVRMNIHIIRFSSH